MKKVLLVSLSILFIAGCSVKHNYKTTASGIKYVDNKPGTGDSAKMGDLLTVDYSAWIVKDNSDLFGNWENNPDKMKNLFFSTDSIRQSKRFVLGTNMLVKGCDEGLVGMKVGGTRTMVIPAELAYGKEGADNIPPNTDIRLKVKLLNSKKAIQSSEWWYDSSKVQSTKMGLKYIILQDGKGPAPTEGQSVIINYSGFLSNGKKFDSSIDREEAVQFIIGKNQVIPGLEDGIKLMNKGAKAVIIIPPSLAYGDRDMGVIPPNSTLIFDVELLNVE